MDWSCDRNRALALNSNVSQHQWAPMMMIMSVKNSNNCTIEGAMSFPLCSAHVMCTFLFSSCYKSRANIIALKYKADFKLHTSQPAPSTSEWHVPSLVNTDSQDNTPDTIDNIFLILQHEKLDSSPSDGSTQDSNYICIGNISRLQAGNSEQALLKKTFCVFCVRLLTECIIKFKTETSQKIQNILFPICPKQKYPRLAFFLADIKWWIWHDCHQKYIPVLFL